MQIRNRVRELRYVKAAELTANPKNWRTHPASQKEALLGILGEVGYADALLARELHDGSLVLIDGHLRAETTPEQEVPVLILDVSQAEADKLILTLDPLASLAESNAAALDALLREVDTGSEALQQLYADLAANSDLYQTDEKPEEEEEPPPPLADEAVTKAGDLWSLGEHRLLCGDSTSEADVSRLMAGEFADLCFTSPPYASQRKYDEGSGFKPIPVDSYVQWWKAIQSNVRSSLSPSGSFFVNIKPHCDDGQRVLYVHDLVIAMVREWSWHFKDEAIWRHTGRPGRVWSTFKNQFEPIYHFALSRSPACYPEQVAHKSDSVPQGGGTNLSRAQGTGKDTGFDVKEGMAYPGNVIECAYPSESFGHAAAFPIGLPAFFIKAYSLKGGLVYEPFGGSGTTLVAAEQFGRRCFSMEISPLYCDVIVKRWEALSGLKAHLVAR